MCLKHIVYLTYTTYWNALAHLVPQYRRRDEHTAIRAWDYPKGRVVMSQKPSDQARDRMRQRERFLPIKDPENEDWDYIRTKQFERFRRKAMYAVCFAGIALRAAMMLTL